MSESSKLFILIGAIIALALAVVLGVTMLGGDQTPITNIPAKGDDTTLTQETTGSVDTTGDTTAPETTAAATTETTEATEATTAPTTAPTTATEPTTKPTTKPTTPTQTTTPSEEETTAPADETEPPAPAGGKPAEWESGDIMIPISAGGQISGVIV